MDFNRSGVGLLEIVTDPYFNSISEAVYFASQLNQLLVNNAIIDDSIETGSFRVDANISLEHRDRENSSSEQNNKVEIKNIMGFKFMQTALGNYFRGQII